MKSSKTELMQRGFVTEGFEQDFFHLSLEEKLLLLEHNQPCKRTLGARLLKGSTEQETLAALLAALKKEKKLYTKIEICESIASIGTTAIIPLINLLGVIGNNQHKFVPKEEFKKKSYPLPRDIAARILIRIGKSAIPELLPILHKKDPSIISEAVDAIGFICFKNDCVNVFAHLKECFIKYENSDLIKWKIIRSMSSFPESKGFLLAQKNLIKNKRVIFEIERSLSLIENGK